jgi:DNA-binding XRE family transcriptional regulator
MQMKHPNPVVTALQERREELDMSREALGVAAGGISSTTIWRMENGTVRPHRSTVAALARALGVNVEDITPKHESPAASEALAASSTFGASTRACRPA